MVSSELRLALFSAVDRAAPDVLAHRRALRAYLYDLASGEGGQPPEGLEDYVEILVEEFSPDPGPFSRR